MNKKEILLILTDQWSDWEAAFVLAELNFFHSDNYAVKTAALDMTPKASMGGIRAEIDYTIENYHNFNNLAMAILPGGTSWKKDENSEIAKFVQKLAEEKIPVAAICGSVAFLARHGFLDNIKHTTNSLERLQEEKNYKGDKFFVNAQAVIDGNFITANMSAALEFAHEIFKTLKLGEDYEDKSKWYDFYKNGMIREE